jgi:hypothetical protein
VALSGTARRRLAALRRPAEEEESGEGSRLGVKTRRRSGLPEQQRRAASDRGSNAALEHSGRNGGEAGEASD